MQGKQIFRTNEEEDIIEGTIVQAFFYNGCYYLENIEIYEDGVINCWKHMTLEEFKEQVNSGSIVAAVPKGQPMSIDHVSSFAAPANNFNRSNEELVREVEDALNKLEGKKTRAEACTEAFYNYLLKPTKKKLEVLKAAHKALPPHLQEHLFEFTSWKCALKHLIDSGVEPTKEQRAYFLFDYFDYILPGAEF